jgi:hypothetical protein
MERITHLLTDFYEYGNPLLETSGREIDKTL